MVTAISEAWYDVVAAQDQIVILEAGRIVEHGSQADLRADPSTRYARLLATGATTEVDAALLEPGAPR